MSIEATNTDPPGDAPGYTFALGDLAFAGLAALYFRLTFSGPFRWAIDLELARFGNYSETWTAVGLCIVAFVPIWLCEFALRKLFFPRATGQQAVGWAMGAPFAVILLAGIGFGGFEAWRLWEPAHSIPSRHDPIQVVDLDQLGSGPMPTGHVRLIGKVDRSRQTVLHFTGRNGSGHSESWQPVIPLEGQGVATRVRIVALRSGRSDEDVVPGIPNTLEGILAPSDIDMSTVYEMKKRGIQLAEPSYTLDWPGNNDRTSLDDRWFSVLLILGMAGALGISAWSTLQDARIRNATPVQGPAPMQAPVASPAQIVVTAPAETATTEGTSWWIAVLIGVIAVLILLCTVFWNFLQNWLYPVAGGTTVVGWIGWWLFDKLTGDSPKSAKPVSRAASASAPGVQASGVPLDERAPTRPD